MFPDKHVYKKDGRYWELTDFVLRVWAARIVGVLKCFAHLSYLLFYTRSKVK